MKVENVNKHKLDSISENRIYGTIKYNLHTFEVLHKYLEFLKSSAKITHFTTKEAIDLLKFVERLSEHQYILKETEVFKINMQK